MVDPDEVLHGVMERLKTPARIDMRWHRCEGGRWCRLDELQLAPLSRVFGVYAIWHGSVPPQYVRVGQGLVGSCLAECRADPEVAKYSPLVLYATWAAVIPAHADGVEAYLALQCNPLVGERFPDRVPIGVNLPFFPSSQ